MLTTLALASVLVFTPIDGVLVCVDDAPRPVTDGYQAMYEAGVDYDAFLAAANQRKELWHGNSDKAHGLDLSFVERAKAVGGSWHFLVVAIDSCSDSVSTVPYLAQLVSLVDGLDLRIVDPTAGQAVMEAHRTPDGRAATPTILLLDDSFEARGCFIERPRSLADWMIENDGKIGRATLVAQKMEWYAENAGQETVEELVGILEAAASGRTVCGR
ncbi:MAG: thioredoxin family protein [Gemmatimonadetes bacterium]|jgi:hypothetical protein|nr:thioredoxin family protein [Gemmatimonadota bacterium]